MFDLERHEHELLGLQAGFKQIQALDRLVSAATVDALRVVLQIARFKAAIAEKWCKHDYILYIWSGKYIGRAEIVAYLQAESL